MSAYVEAMFSVRKEPWHGLGTVLDEPPTIQDAILQAGLDWEVKLQRMKAVVDLGTFSQEFPVENAKAICRMGKNGLIERSFGIVTNKYVPLQNSEAFEFFQPILDSGKVHLETAGSLKDGEIVWVLAKLDEDIHVGMDIKGDVDKVRPYLLLSMGHNGKRSVKVSFTPIRVVCWNTLSMSDKDQGIIIPHRKGVADTVKAASFDFAETLKTYEEIGKVFKEMNRFKATDDDAIRLAEHMLPVPDKALPGVIELVMKKRHNVYENFIAEVQTMWGLYNAFTGFIDHDVITRNGDEGRLNNSWFGSGSKMKTVAFNAIQGML